MKRLFAPPVFADEDKTRVANLLSVTMLTLFLIAVTRTMLFLAAPRAYFLVVLQINLVLTGALCITYVLMRGGYVRLASMILTLFQWLLTALLTYQYGITMSSYGIFIFVTFVAGLLLGGKYAIGYAAASVLYGALALYLESRGVIVTAPESPILAFGSTTPSFITTAVLVYLYYRDITKALTRARRNEQAAADRAAQMTLINTQLSREIAERKQAEEKLNEYHELLEELVKARTTELAVAKERAEAASQAKSAFLASMSHELRTPLNAILGFTQLMERDAAFPPHQRENLNIINHSGEHLLALINDVLEMSKVEAGRVSLDKTDFDLYQLLDALESLFSIRAKDKGLQLRFERIAELPRYIRTDERKLRQVLINLLGNAVKFTNTGSVTLRVGQVYIPDDDTMTMGSRSTTLHFAVADTGPGIAPDEMDKMFEAFAQTASGEHVQNGTGLGLALSQQFVHLMGGDITVSSRVGQGSAFTFDIQVEVVAALKVQPPRRARRVVGLESGQPRHRILVVEDNDDSRALLHKLLKEVGFAVREARDGQEAVELNASWRPHLVWMDIRMPTMDGYEATRRIKAQPPAPVVIALTASAFEEQRIIVLAAGCDDFVRKPFAEEEIFAKMQQYLGVSYVYEDLAHPEQRDGAPSYHDLTPQDLAAVSAEQITALHQAAMVGSSKAMLALIAQLPPEHAALAERLTELVHDFRFDKLIMLTAPKEVTDERHPKYST